MVQFIVGEKGQGKTKRLIQLCNEAGNKSDGNVVFIDDDRRHIYDLNHKVRFVETGNFPLSNYREFIGFVCGILSQDNDITHVFVDGLTNVIKTLDNESLVKLVAKLEKLSSDNSLDFIISINKKVADFPEDIENLII